jgi:hypothetical protein
VTAADLPDHSVVADDTTAWIKTYPNVYTPWRGTNGSSVGGWRIDEALANGAQVLRVGTGEVRP